MPEQPQNGVTIRRATPADLPSLGRLGALMVDTHHAFDQKRFFATSDSTPGAYAAFLRSQFLEPAAVVLVAETDGRVIGYAYATVEGYDFMSLREPAGVLQDVMVDPAYRGRGAGRLLVEAALSFLKSRGAPRVILSTAERNAAAQRLFLKMGFRRTMVEMTRELDP